MLLRFTAMGGVNRVKSRKDRRVAELHHVSDVFYELFRDAEPVVPVVRDGTVGPSRERARKQRSKQRTPKGTRPPLWPVAIW